MGKRILVADDSQTIQQAFAYSFGLEDAVLVPARSFDQAMNAAKQQRPDIVIADALLGDGSGYDLCSMLKSDGGLSDVPVFILASKQNPFDEGKAAAVGADGHFIKPFESQKIIEAVYAAISTGVSSTKPTPIVSMGVVGSAVPEIQDSTSKISDVEAVPLDDEDSYGEFSIETSPTTTVPAPAQSTPAPVRMPPPAAPMRPPVAAAAPTPPPLVRPAPPAPTSPPRPSLIPGVRPGQMRPPAPPPQALGQRSALPAPARAPTATRPTVPSTPAAPDDASARPTMNRTMMGMPSSFAAGAAPNAPLSESRAPIASPTPPEPIRPNVIPISESVRQPITTPMVPPPAMEPDVRGRSALADKVRSAVDDKVAELSAKGPEYAAIAKLSREVIEQIVWEVVPELAEVIIRENLDRLTKK